MIDNPVNLLSSLLVNLSILHAILRESYDIVLGSTLVVIASTLNYGFGGRIIRIIDMIIANVYGMYCLYAFTYFNVDAYIYTYIFYVIISTMIVMYWICDLSSCPEKGIKRHVCIHILATIGLICGLEGVYLVNNKN
jgi:hypothetical protein